MRSELLRAADGNRCGRWRNVDARQDAHNVPHGERSRRGLNPATRSPDLSWAGRQPRCQTILIDGCDRHVAGLPCEEDAGGFLAVDSEGTRGELLRRADVNRRSRRSDIDPRYRDRGEWRAVNVCAGTEHATITCGSRLVQGERAGHVW